MSPRQVRAQPAAPVSPWRTLRWLAGSTILLVVIIALSYGVWLYQQQEALIYGPRPTSAAETAAATASGAKILSFEVGGQRQAAWLLPPGPELTAPRLWIMCIGQGGVGAQWLREPGYLVPSLHRATGAAFLLIDYPGSGEATGTPSPQAVLDLTRAAQTAALDCLGWKRATTRIGVVGMSLGTGIAAQHAAAEHCERLVLISPYTTLLEVVQQRQPWPLWHLLRHRYDTRAALHLVAQVPQAEVLIYHGVEDQAIPVAMARDLARAHPTCVQLVEVPGAGHGDVLDAVLPQAITALTAMMR
jgi:uncharacterized protein